MPLLRHRRMEGNDSKKIYWHYELPPFGADAIGEHTVEATSSHVAGTIAHRDELWTQCYEDLMAQACVRLQEEMIRLGGNFGPSSVKAWTASTIRSAEKRGYTAVSPTCFIDRPKAMLAALDSHESISGVRREEERDVLRRG